MAIISWKVSPTASLKTIIELVKDVSYAAT